MLSTLYFPTTIFHGADSIQRIGEACDLLEVKHPLIIASKRAKAQLKSILQTEKNQHLNLDYFTDFSGEPTTDHVEALLKCLHDSHIDSIIAIGGGTPIDLAKVVAALAINDELSLNNLHTAKNLRRYPLIAIPTTAGTGSEVTKIAVITDVKRNVKYNPAHPGLIPDIAILDPKLTLTLPKQITAQTGMDALAHAMEAYVSTLASPMSDVFALEAIQLISTYLHRTYDKPEDLEARDGMLRASCLAGIAFSNASTNLAHATARPLGTRFELPHGLSVALTLPHVIEYGSEFARERYKKIALALDTTSTLDYVKDCNKYFEIDKLAKEKLTADQLIPMIPTLVHDALSGNGIETNKQIPTKKDVTAIYQKLADDLMEE